MSELSVITLAAAKAYTDEKTSEIQPQVWIGNTTTALSEGSTTNPITINGSPVTAVSGNIAAYDGTEFIFTGTAWQKFGGKFTDLTDVNVTNPAGGQIVQYDATLQKFVNGMKVSTLTATLTTGNTDVTFTNALITNTARYDVYTDPFVPYDDISLSGTTITVTFAEQESDVSVKLVITEDV